MGGIKRNLPVLDKMFVEQGWKGCHGIAAMAGPPVLGYSRQFFLATQRQNELQIGSGNGNISGRRRSAVQFDFLKDGPYFLVDRAGNRNQRLLVDIIKEDAIAGHFFPVVFDAVKIAVKTEHLHFRGLAGLPFQVLVGSQKDQTFSAAGIRGKVQGKACVAVEQENQIVGLAELPRTARAFQRVDMYKRKFQGYFF